MNASILIVEDEEALTLLLRGVKPYSTSPCCPRGRTSDQGSLRQLSPGNSGIGTCPLPTPP